MTSKKCVAKKGCAAKECPAVCAYIEAKILATDNCSEAETWAKALREYAQAMLMDPRVGPK